MTRIATTGPVVRVAIEIAISFPESRAKVDRNRGNDVLERYVVVHILTHALVAGVRCGLSGTYVLAGCALKMHMSLFLCAN